MAARVERSTPGAGGFLLGVGHDTVDVQLDADALHVEYGVVEVCEGGQAWRIPLSEEPLSGKAAARIDLSGFRAHPRARISACGGRHNSVMWLRHLQIQGDPPPARLVSLGLTTPSPELREDMLRAGFPHYTICHQETPVNLILVQRGVADRLILQSPVTPDEPDPPAVQAIIDSIQGQMRVLVVNSMRSRVMTRLALQAARDCGAFTCCGLTKAHPPRECVDLLLPNSHVAVANLAEFARAAAALDVKSPTNEGLADWNDTAVAIHEVMRRRRSGDIAVTLGDRGCAVAERASGTVFRVSLRERPHGLVQQRLRENPVLISGSGDRFLGGLTLAYTTDTPMARGSRAAGAALRASIAVVGSYGIQAAPEWFHVEAVATVRSLPAVTPALPAMAAG